MTGQPLTEDIPFETDGVSTGGELLDATQNAIIDAAENVSEVFEKTDSAVVHHGAELPFYAEVEFWVGMAFILAILSIIKPLYKYIKKALQNKAQAVVAQIDEAMKLRDDAQQTLAEYENKFANTELEVAQILQDAKKNTAALKRAEQAKVKNILALKEKEAQRRIDSSIQKVLAEINETLSKSAVSLAKDTIFRHLQQKSKSQLIDEAINELDKFESKIAK